jgi:hypothetical protein
MCQNGHAIPIFLTKLVIPTRLKTYLLSLSLSLSLSFTSYSGKTEESVVRLFSLN